MNAMSGVCAEPSRKRGGTSSRSVSAVAVWFGFVLAALLPSGPASAHAVSTAYLQLAGGAPLPVLRVDLPLRDLEDLVGLDADGDGRLTWREVEFAGPQIASRIAAGIEVRRGDRVCQPEARPVAIEIHAGTPHASLEYALRCPAGGAWSLDYHLLFDRDRTHRALLAVSGEGAPVGVILDADRHLWTESASGWTRFIEFLRQGVWHIWLGYDHLAFLLLLLLPAFSARSERTAGPSLRAVLLRVLRIVTAFTIAHSVTLTLATLGVVRPPVVPIEAAIAATVIATGIINLFPRLAVHGAGLAFAFGLIHGFGFANALSELGLSHGAVLAPLAGFNLGVEAGQLAAVLAVLPVLASLRHRPIFDRVVVPALSAAIAVLAVGWLLQRVGVLGLGG
jgi:hypothetical protein